MGGNFDGTALYEHADPARVSIPTEELHLQLRGLQRCAASALLGMFWLDRYHADGLRVDAVASHALPRYSRKAGECIRTCMAAARTSRPSASCSG